MSNLRGLLDLPRPALERYCEERVRIARLDSRTSLCRVLGRHLMYVDHLDESVGPRLMFDGFWESWITKALGRLPRGTAVDVGANVGYFSLLLAELCGYCVAFEPQKDLARLLQKSQRLNGLREQLEVVQAAVGAESGQEMVIRMPEGEPEDRSAAHCEPLAEGMVLHGHDSPTTTVTLDDHFRGWNGAPVVFVKLDTEGMEPLIWAGMQEVVAKYRPTILLEFTPRFYEDPEGFLDALESCYPIATVNGDGLVVPADKDEILSNNEYTMLWLEKK